MKKTCENCWMDRIINWMTILTIQHNTTQWNIIEMCRKCRLAHHACTTSASLSSDSAFQISEYSVTIRIIFQWLSTGILTRSISCFTIETRLARRLHVRETPEKVLRVPLNTRRYSPWSLLSGILLVSSHYQISSNNQNWEQCNTGS